MKLLVFQNLPSGGAKRALCEWVKQLSERHTIDVYSLSSADHAFQDLQPYVRHYRIFAFEPEPLFGPPLRRFNQLKYLRDLKRLERLAIDMSWAAAAGSYDAAFLNPCQYTSIPALAVHLDAPMLYYLHEPFGPRFTRSIERPYLRGSSIRSLAQQMSLLRPLYAHRLEALRRLGVTRIRQFLANSAFTRDEMSRCYGITSEVCYCGVDTEVFVPRPEISKEHAVLSVGALTPRKGFDFLIRSLALIPLSERPCLRIASNGEIPAETDYLVQLASSLDVRIEILRSLDTQQLCREYNRASLCVYSPVKEPFGLVPLEAMACSTPVVAVAEGGVCESIVDGVTGVLCPRVASDFAEAVRSLLGDPSAAARLGARAREYVRGRWTWTESTAQLERHLLATAETPR